jgi:hypothetical protein
MVLKSGSQLPKTGSQLPDSGFVLTESAFAGHLAGALREDLGATRRAAKTVMRWTGVSDRTARAWLQGTTSPSGLHLVALAARSELVMAMVLRLTGHSDLGLVLRLHELETGLEQALCQVRALSGHGASQTDLN